MVNTKASYDDGDGKYKKKGKGSAQALYVSLGVIMGFALVYSMMPYRNQPTVVKNEVKTTAFATQEEIELQTEVEDAMSAMEDSEKQDDENGLSTTYPKYEETLEKDVLVNPQETVEEQSLGVEEEDMDENNESTDDQYADALDGDIFVDQVEYDNAPIIKVLPESRIRKYSKIVLSHERYYRKHPTKLYVPTLKKNSRLSVEQFRKIFMERSQPVIIPFQAMRHLNFTTKAGWTLEELKSLYPNSQPALYKYGAIVQKEIDLGPAVASLMENRKLKKTTVGKSYPRNTKFVLKSLTKLNIQNPPFIPNDIPMMLPSLWFASTSEATPLHSDCCDNWAMMISGTKKWYLAPPSEARILKPNCKGGLCWVKKLVHSDKHARTPQEIRLRDNTQLVHVDLPAGYILYLPAGWFHHVEQEEPTVMINFWAKGGSAFTQHYDKLVGGSTEYTAASGDNNNMENDSMANSYESRSTRTNPKDTLVGGTVVAGTL